MPSKSPAQARLMAAVAHGWKEPGGGGPPVSVAKEFNQADKGTGIMSNKGYQGKEASYAQGGEVIGATSKFMKQPNRSEASRFMSVPDEFRNPDNANPNADEDDKYAKSGDGQGTGFIKPPAAKDKSCKPPLPRS